jgi:hypothetical protein
MEFDPQDQEIVRLLTKLKDGGEKYPEPLLAARRQSYLTHMAEIGLGVSAARGIEHAIKKGPPPSSAPVGSTLLETALVVAIVAEASAVAYFYREKLSDFFQTITTEPRVQEVTPLPVETLAAEIQGITPSAAVTVTLSSITVSPSPSGTVVTFTHHPIPGVADENNPASPAVNQAESTPVPNNNTNTNNGNHYGQTPLPERTKEPGSNNNQKQSGNDVPSQSGNNDQTPKDKPGKTK